MRHIPQTILFILICTLTNAQMAGQLLENANKKKSKEILKDFFETWHNEIKPISDEELNKENDTIKQAYKVFSAFYKRLDIDSLGGSEWGSKIYNDVTYLILQNRIFIYSQDKIFYSEKEVEDFVVDKIKKTVGEDTTRQKLLKREGGKLDDYVLRQFGPKPSNFDDNEKSIEIDSVINFRPQITCNKTPLYLTNNYNEILNAFLGNSHSKLVTGGIMNPAKSKGESEKRKKFLEIYIKTVYGYWGGYWQLNSYIFSSSVTFDRNFEYAKIQFEMPFESGVAIFKKDNEQWKLITSQVTWIE